MRNLNAIAHECESDIVALGISIGKIDNYTINTRAKSRLGQCVKKSCGRFDINISAVLLREDIPIDELKSTLYHEILHTCYGCFNHGARWQELAHKASAAYGVEVSRTASKTEKSAQILTEERVAKRGQPKYRYQCVDCGCVIERYRESNFTRYPNNYCCASCHGKFQRI